MKKKVWIIPDNLCIYMRVGRKEQVNDDLLILHKSEAIELAKTILKQSKKVPYLLSLERGGSKWHL